MPGAVMFCDLLLNFNTPRAFAHRTEATIHRQAVQRSHVATLAPLTGTRLSHSFSNTSLLVRFLACPPIRAVACPPTSVVNVHTGYASCTR
jgi:hypothetical protein